MIRTFLRFGILLPTFLGCQTADIPVAVPVPAAATNALEMNSQPVSDTTPEVIAEAATEQPSVPVPESPDEKLMHEYIVVRMEYADLLSGDSDEELLRESEMRCSQLLDALRSMPSKSLMKLQAKYRSEWDSMEARVTAAVKAQQVTTPDTSGV